MEDEFLTFSQEDIEEAKRKMAEAGVRGLSEYLNDNLARWRKVPLRVGVVGESGVGKSTFINAMRGLTADDKGGAPVGTGDTTLEPTPYPHPDNKELVFWDLPGVGTPNFPRATYSSKIDLKSFDFFLILSDDRFTTNDAWLAQEIKHQGKTFYFVRTKIDDAIENAQHTERGNFSESKMAQRIRQNCTENFQRAKVKCEKVYLISNFNPDKWDYGRLMEDILFALPEQKRLALVLSLGPMSKSIIREKTEILKGRVWKIATMSAVGSAAASVIPVAGAAASVVLDIGIVVKEVDFYLKQYGMDENALNHLSQRAHTTKQVLLECLRSSSGTLLARKTVQEMVKTILVGESTEAVVKQGAKLLPQVIPLVGALVSGVASFTTCFLTLNKIIDDFEKDAEAIVDKVVEITSSAL